MTKLAKTNDKKSQKKKPIARLPDLHDKTI